LGGMPWIGPIKRESFFLETARIRVSIGDGTENLGSRTVERHVKRGGCGKTSPARPPQAAGGRGGWVKVDIEAGA